MERSQLRGIIEALIFAAEEPIGESGMLAVLEPEAIEKTELREALAELVAGWNDNPAAGLVLREIAGGYQFCTRESAAEWVRRLFASKPARLSQAAMETLAIVAYRQPIIRSEIEDVRGVDCGAVLKKLVERGLIRIIGKRDEPGQPLIYGTTKEFLALFGLPALKDLPPLKDLRELAERRAAELGHTPAGEGAVAQDARASGDGADEYRDRDAEDDDNERSSAMHDDAPKVSGEVIQRLTNDEAEDEDALQHLEANIKSLRRLERALFPAILPQVAPETRGEEHGEASEVITPPSDGAPIGAETLQPPEDAVAEGAAEQVDRADE